MNATQRLDQADAIKAAIDALRHAQTLYRLSMDFLAEVDRHDLEETLASTSGVVAADIAILGDYLRELEEPRPVLRTYPCATNTGLHMVRGNTCTVCGKTED